MSFSPFKIIRQGTAMVRVFLTVNNVDGKNRASLDSTYDDLRRLKSTGISDTTLSLVYRAVQQIINSRSKKTIEGLTNRREGRN